MYECMYVGWDWQKQSSYAFRVSLLLSICNIYVCMHALYVCMHVCMYACMYVSMFVGVYGMNVDMYFLCW